MNLIRGTARRYRLPELPGERPYVVGTGWWCDGSGSHPGSEVATNPSSRLIREREFFRVWYEFIDRYTEPEKIIVVDSASPVRPELPDDPRLEFLSLAQNWGHFRACEATRMCGVERAHLACANYAFLNDCDLVYVEQDCLVVGDRWLETCMSQMRRGKIMYGSGRSTPQPVQQSLAIVRWSFLPTFSSRLIDQYERHSRAMISDSKRNLHNPEWRWHEAFNKDVDLLPIGYGRQRPIDFENAHFYAQHWTMSELAELSRRVDSRALARLCRR